MKGLRDMQPVWQQFKEMCHGSGVSSLQEQQGQLHSIIAALKPVIVPGKAALAAMIKRESFTLEYVYQDEEDRQIRFMAGVWADITREDEAAYLVEAMKRSYSYAGAQRGAGSTKTMFAIMNQIFLETGDKNVYNNVARLVDKTFEIDAAENTSPLVESVTSVFRRIATQAQMMIAAKEQETHNNTHLNHARSLLKPWVTKARKQHRQIKKDISEMKKTRPIG